MQNTMKVGILAIGLSLTSGCGAALRTCPSPGLPAVWSLSVRPVDLAISDELPQECLDTVLSALDWWREKGITYVIPKMVTSDYKIGLGDIFISNKEIWSDDPVVAGTAMGRITENRKMVHSEIRFRRCEFWVAIHELGHGLGLAHHNEQCNVMYESNLCDSEFGNITDKQIDQIR